MDWRYMLQIMTEEIYNEAIKLHEDIRLIKYQLDEVEKREHWITIATPYKKDACYSEKFQSELVKWLEGKLKDYEIKFAQLGM